MNISMKSKKALGAVMILLLFCAITAIIGLKERSIVREGAVLTTVSGKRPVLIIDAGHGGEDGGASSSGGVPESGINLDIALRLEALAAFLGIDTVMTRVSENLGYPEGMTIAEKKVWDQHRRLELINSTDGVLLSIHQNSFPDPRPYGPQVLYSAQAGSMELAELTHANLNTFLCPENRRVAAPSSDSIYLMKNAECPAILIECGFLSNASDAEKLLNNTYKTKLAVILAASYVQFSS